MILCVYKQIQHQKAYFFGFNQYNHMQNFQGKASSLVQFRKTVGMGTRSYYPILRLSKYSHIVKKIHQELSSWNVSKRRGITQKVSLYQTAQGFIKNWSCSISNTMILYGARAISWTILKACRTSFATWATLPKQNLGHYFYNFILVS